MSAADLDTPQNWGRRSKLTKERRELVASYVAAGNTPCVAARLAGVSSATHQRWMARGRERKRGPYYRYMRAIEKAEASFIQEAVKGIKQAGAEDWKALAWLLARRAPDTWGEKQSVKLEGNVNHTGGVRVFLPPEDDEGSAPAAG